MSGDPNADEGVMSPVQYWHARAEKAEAREAVLCKQIDDEAAHAYKRIKQLEREGDAALRWVDDLQADMYINCVYCGHRYGPDSEVPATMADALKEHVESCPKHPMSELRATIESVKALVERWRKTHLGVGGVMADQLEAALEGVKR